MKKNRAIALLEMLIFNTKWLLIFFYFGLMAVLLVYTFTYAKEVFYLIQGVQTLTTDNMMLKILEVVDIVMVANLVKMIITGSYNSFVSKQHEHQNENISSGMLKVKMATSMVGVSSIHLLRSFIDSKEISWPEVNKQMAIHGILIIGSLIFAAIEYLHILGERVEEDEKAAH